MQLSLVFIREQAAASFLRAEAGLTVFFHIARKKEIDPARKLLSVRLPGSQKLKRRVLLKISSSNG